MFSLFLFDGGFPVLVRARLTTVCSIETWALEEAKRRLQAEGILPEEEQS